MTWILRWTVDGEAFEERFAYEHNAQTWVVIVWRAWGVGARIECDDGSGIVKEVQAVHGCGPNAARTFCRPA